MNRTTNEPTPSEVNEAIESLIRMGVLSRWWCDKCGDYVPYQTLEMTESQSRRKHARATHPRKAQAHA